MTIITTAYLTPIEAQVYFNGRLGTDAWDCSSDADKSKALIQATRAIDRLNYYGVRPDGQELQFPRDQDTVVPGDIQCACAEESLALLDGKDPELERESLGITKQQFAKVKVEFSDNTSRTVNIIHGIMSATAWSYLLPYMRDPLAIRISRVS